MKGNLILHNLHELMGKLTVAFFCLDLEGIEPIDAGTAEIISVLLKWVVTI
jgi:hypothetical protein